MSELTIGFIGFGLIGGSIAKALKEKHSNYSIYAYNYHKAKINQSLILAKEDHVIDAIHTELSEFHDCDIIFLCAPVLSNINYLKELKSIIKPTCILTDVGSVKGNIHQAVMELNMTSSFIGGHPMAGSEKTGYESSHSRLLENAYYILTPTKETPQWMIDRMYQLVTEISAIPILLNDIEHDDITAAISHVPHIIAASLVNMVKDSDGEGEKMKILAAGGFRDITRIASSSPIMWQNICLTNESITKFLDRYILYLQDFKGYIEGHEEDKLLQAFETASDYRSSLPVKENYLLKKTYEVFLDIENITGIIAKIATVLANHEISIKNIGIINNREFEQGVLRIEFYDEESLKKAILLFHESNYVVCERK